MDLTILLLLIVVELQLLAALVLYARNTRHKRGDKPVFIDTSVLMDGRIAAIVSSGFIPSALRIPKSVLKELQLLADGSDSVKRTRARHGLDVAKQLQDLSPTITVSSDTTSGEVDEHLIELAKTHGGAICTIDFNLNKRAAAQGIAVLNPNDLSRDLRMSYLPGEHTSVLIAQKGSEPHQGVGYLEDGTMVVVDQAKANIGTMQAVEVVKNIQTAAGKMLFAKKIQASAISTDNNDATKSSRLSKSKPKSNGRRPKPGTEDSLVALANK